MTTPEFRQEMEHAAASVQHLLRAAVRPNGLDTHSAAIALMIGLISYIRVHGNMSEDRIIGLAKSAVPTVYQQEHLTSVRMD